MSARRVRARPSAQSYTARLQRRMVSRPRRRVTNRLTAPWLTAPRLAAPLLAAKWPPALLMLGAEAGHLAAAAAQWPTLAQRGAFHVVVAAIFGFVAVGTYFGPTRLELRIGLAVSLLSPACWLVGAIIGVSPYRDCPVLFASAVSITEIMIAALLASRLRASGPYRAGARSPTVTRGRTRHT